MFGDRTGSSDGLFSPHGSADGQADRLPPPLPPPSAPLGGKRSCSVKSEARYLSPEPQSDSEPLISLTCRWSEGPSPEPVSVWNMLKQTVRAKAIKTLPCAGLSLTRALWHDYKILKVSTHLGIGTQLPDDVEKNPLHPSCFWITYFSFFPLRWVRRETGTRWSCQSSDLCLICRDVFTEALLSRIH